MLICLLLLLIPCQVFAELTREQKDSGWVLLFNGVDFEGIEAFDEDLGFGENEGMFIIEDSIITGNRMDKIGFLLTGKVYSHYRVRVEYTFPQTGNTGQNAGMLHHSQDTSVSPLFNGRWPASVECQGQIRGAGELWAINVLVNTTVDPNNTKRYMEGGQDIVVRGTGGSSRQILASSNEYVDGEWNFLEILSLGSEFFAHIVNGVVVFRGTDIRLVSNEQPLESGKITLQQEMATVQYKNWMIMELDAQTGEPLKPWGCLDPAYKEYDSTRTLHDSAFCETPVTYGCKTPGYEETDTTVDIHVDSLCRTLGINIKMSAMPFEIGEKDHKISVTIPFSGVNSVHVYDVTGNLVYSEQGAKKEYVISVKTGVYFIKTGSGHSKKMKKVAVY